MVNVIWIVLETIVLLFLLWTILRKRQDLFFRKKEIIQMKVKDSQEIISGKLIDLIEKHKYFHRYYKEEETQKVVQEIEVIVYKYLENYQFQVEQYSKLEKLYNANEISKREFYLQLTYFQEEYDHFIKEINEFENEILYQDSQIQNISQVIGKVQQKLKELESAYLEFEKQISLDLFIYENRKNQLHSSFKCIITLRERDPLKCKIMLMNLQDEIVELLDKLPIVGAYYQSLEEVKNQKLELKQKIKKSEDVGWDFIGYDFSSRFSEVNTCQQYSLNALKRGNMNEISQALSLGKQILDHIEKQINNHIKMGYEIDKKISQLYKDIQKIQTDIYSLSEMDIEKINEKYEIDATAHFEKYIEWLNSYQYDLEGIKQFCETQEFRKALSILIDMEQKVLEIHTKYSLLTLQSIDYTIDEIKYYVKVLQDQLEFCKDILKYYKIHQHDNEIRAYQRELTGLLNYIHQDTVDMKGIHGIFKRVYEQVTHMHKKVIRICHAYEIVTYFMPFIEQEIYEIKKNMENNMGKEENEIQESYYKIIKLVEDGDYLHAKENMKILEGALQNITA